MQILYRPSHNDGFLHTLTLFRTSKGKLTRTIDFFRRKVVAHQEKNVFRKCSHQEGARSHREDGGARFGLERSNASRIQRTPQDTQRGHVQTSTNR